MNRISVRASSPPVLASVGIGGWLLIVLVAVAVSAGVVVVAMTMLSGGMDRERFADPGFPKETAPVEPAMPAPAESNDRPNPVLDADPGEAISVKQALAAEPGTEVVVVGRLADKIRDRAAIFLMDMALEPCDEDSMCPTPWDYCCCPLEEVKASRLLVAFMDAEGRSQPDDDRLQWRPLDIVKFTGTVRRLDSGMLTMDATGFYRVERPSFSWDIMWPDWAR